MLLIRARPKMTHRSSWLLAGLFTPWLAWGAPASSPQVDAPPMLTGTYTFSQAPDELKQLQDQIETAIADIPFLFKPLARKRLSLLTTPADTFTFTPQAQGLRVANAWVVRDCVLSGAPSTFQDRRGQTRQSVCTPEGLGVRETFSGPEAGSWTHTFMPSKTGETVTQVVTVTAPALAAPVAFALTYRKQAGG